MGPSDQVDGGDEHGAADQGSPLAVIAAEMVRLYKEQFARGPTKARANWSGRDMIVGSWRTR